MGYSPISLTLATFGISPDSIYYLGQDLFQLKSGSLLFEENT